MKRLETINKLLRYILARNHTIEEVEQLIEDAYLMGKTDGAIEITQEMIAKFEK